jgi:CHAT domain-containing protein
MPLHAQSDELKETYDQGMALVTAGRYNKAIPYFEKILELHEQKFGSEHPNTTKSLNDLGLLYSKQGRYAEAEPLFKRSLAIREKALGAEHPDVATSLNNIALNYNAQGRYGEAEPLLKRSLAIREKALGPDHPDVALSLNNIALNYNAQARFGEAEPLLKRSLAILEKALGPEHPNVALSLNSIAKNYNNQGRYAEAEPLFKRSLAIREKALGAEHPDVATSLNNIALNYNAQGRYGEAEPLLKRSLAIREKALGPDHPNVALSINNIAVNYDAQGRYAEAEPLYKRSMEISIEALGPDHPVVATNLLNLAINYGKQGRHGEAGPLYRSSLAIYEKALGPYHPDVASVLGHLSEFYFTQSDQKSALTLIRQANSILKKRFGRASGELSIGAFRERLKNRAFYRFHVRIVSKVIGVSDKEVSALRTESFAAAQQARLTSAGSAVSRMGVRFASGNDALAKLTRAHQDTVNRWRQLEKKLVKAVGYPSDKLNEGLKQDLRKQLSFFEKRLDELDSLLSDKFPEYAALISRQPLPLTDAQSLLAPDEALVTYLVGKEESYLWVVRRDRAEFFKIDLTGKELAEAVLSLRKGLDPSGITSLKQVRPFDTTKAYELYKKLFSPAEKLLEGVRHVMVVPDGALQSLPLGVLVTEEPQGSFAGFSGYRQVPWLAKKYALTTLPSVSSLKVLRVFAKKGNAKQPFTGFGDPVLDGQSGTRGGVELASLFSRGSIVDVDQLKSLGSLTDTADELRAMAESLNAGEDTVYLGPRATESRVKEMDLSDVRILAFATHGLVAGQLKGVSEPGLVLTPPEKSNEQDDGFLTASEVAQLKLNADWVILSACNTASPDGTPGAEGLSGLTKAFFYAGSRALLVSHWNVETGSATALTTRMLREAMDKTVGRAEALKRSMMALMNTPDAPHYAHPMFWAAFTVVGEGN